MEKCLVSGCDAPVYAAGMCSRHYNRKRTTGTTDDSPRSRGSLETRFWRQVDKRSASECWPWKSKSLVKGYGYIGLGGRSGGKELAHRVAWLLTHGELPDLKGYHGAVVRHKCHNRLCCNPDHLEIGTQADNVNDMWTREGGPKGNTQLTEKQIAEIRSDPRSSRQLAPLYGVSGAHIRGIRQGRTWKGKSK